MRPNASLAMTMGIQRQDAISYPGPTVPINTLRDDNDDVYD